MRNYSENPASCRVDFFKPSGKWYTTEAVKFPPETYKLHPNEALRHALAVHFGASNRLAGMFAVCIDPYVELSFPVHIML